VLCGGLELVLAVGGGVALAQLLLSGQGQRHGIGDTHAAGLMLVGLVLLLLLLLLLLLVLLLLVLLCAVLRVLYHQHLAATASSAAVQLSLSLSPGLLAAASRAARHEHRSLVPPRSSGARAAEPHVAADGVHVSRAGCQCGLQVPRGQMHQLAAG
jgi:hypothetical protein